VSTSYFVYDNWNLIAEVQPDADGYLWLKKSYLWGQDLSGRLADGDGNAGGIGGLALVTHYSGSVSHHFPFYDGNGKVSALVNAADATVSARYEYGPFGELIRASGPMAKDNPFRFSTKFCEDESGLVYYGYRYYSPTMGRFINRDPIEEDGGNNLYAFVRNNPLNAFDALGMDGTLAEEEAAMAEGEGMEGGGTAAVGRSAGKIKNALDMLQELDDLRSAVMSMEDPSGALIQIQSLAGEMFDAKKSGKMAGSVNHHLTPQMLKRLIPDLAGEVDNFTSALSERLHRRLHSGKGFGRGGIWNGLWNKFIKNKGGKIDEDQMKGFMNQMRKYFSLDALSIKPY
jgi:RHS repeat-associated protein